MGLPRAHQGRSSPRAWIRVRGCRISFTRDQVRPIRRARGPRLQARHRVHRPHPPGLEWPGPHRALLPGLQSDALLLPAVGHARRAGARDRKRSTKRRRHVGRRHDATPGRRRPRLHLALASRFRRRLRHESHPMRVPDDPDHHRHHRRAQRGAKEQRLAAVAALRARNRAHLFDSRHHGGAHRLALWRHLAECLGRGWSVPGVRRHGAQLVRCVRDPSAGEFCHSHARRARERRSGRASPRSRGRHRGIAMHRSGAGRHARLRGGERQRPSRLHALLRLRDGLGRALRRARHLHRAPGWNPEVGKLDARGALRVRAGVLGRRALLPAPLRARGPKRALGRRDSHPRRCAAARMEARARNRSGSAALARRTRTRGARGRAVCHRAADLARQERSRGGPGMAGIRSPSGAPGRERRQAAHGRFHRRLVRRVQRARALHLHGPTRHRARQALRHRARRRHETNARGPGADAQIRHRRSAVGRLCRTRRRHPGGAHRHRLHRSRHHARTHATRAGSEEATASPLFGS